MTESLTWITSPVDTRPRWLSALFPRYPRRVSAGWVWIAFGGICAEFVRDFDGPLGALVYLAAVAVEWYGLIRLMLDD